MLLTLLAFALALGLLVTFHELGHYSVARLCGVRILRFSVGFGPILLRRTDRRGTEWALSAVPLGGYVKMLDDPPVGIDAVQAGAFNGKPLWQRVLVVLAGPFANLLLAVLIYAALGLWGTWQPAAVLGNPPAGTVAAQSGIQAGDTLVEVGGRPVASWTQARWQLLELLSLGKPVTLGVKTPAGTVKTVRLTASARAAEPDGPDPLTLAGIVQAPPNAVLGRLTPGGAAERAGLQPGDRVLAISTGAGRAHGKAALSSGAAGLAVPALVQLIQAHADQPLSITVQRGAAQLSRVVTPVPERTDDGRVVGRIGVLVQAEFPRVLVRRGPLESLGSGVRQTVEISVFSLRMMARMVTGAASLRNVTGPVTIAEYAGETARLGLEPYLNFLALISISIGVLNLLPIPLLDGGHLLFYLLEALRGGRPLSARVQGWGVQAGLALVLGLMFLALYNDFARLLR